MWVNGWVYFSQRERAPSLLVFSIEQGRGSVWVTTTFTKHNHVLCHHKNKRMIDIGALVLLGVLRNCTSFKTNHLGGL